MATWGEDALSAFYAKAEEIAHSAYDELSLSHAGLLEIHSALRLTQDKLVPKGVSGIALLLFTNAHAMFLAASRAALSGHASSVYPVLRASLESALYGLHMATHPKSEQIWANRGDSKKARDKCRAEFSAANVKNTAKTMNKGLGDYVNHAYESLIDFGAHPNTLGVMKHVTMEDGADATSVNLTILWGNSMQKAESLVACYEVGIGALIALAEAFPHWSKEIELTAAVQKLWDEKEVKIKAMVKQCHDADPTQ